MAPPRKWIFLILLVIALGAMFLLVVSLSPSRLEQAMSALEHRDYRGALRLAKEELENNPDSSAALLAAARASLRLKRDQEAFAYYGRMKNDGSAGAAARILEAAEAFRGRERLSPAEALYREALVVEPDLVDAHKGMVYVLGMSGRGWDSLPHLEFLMRTRHDTFFHVVYLAKVERHAFKPGVAETALRADPADPDANLAVARHLIDERKFGDARVFLEGVTKKSPDILEAQARLGEVLIDEVPESFLAWHRELPRNADSHPEIWVLRGRWLRHQGDRLGAIRCFWEAVRLHPNHQLANFQLGQLLSSSEDAAHAREFLDRAMLLGDLADATDILYGLGFHYSIKELPAFVKAAEVCEKLGRLWEAREWARLALGLDEKQTWPGEMIKRIDARLTPNSPLTSSNPALHLDLARRYPLPSWVTTVSETQTGKAASANTSLRFANVAREVGLDFTYFSSGNPESKAIRFFEFTGGGAAVLDYDGDTWPDIYLTQGCVWPPQEGQRKHLDRLYRNLGNGRFEDVTERAGIVEDRYSQGVAVGDYDNDGFPDLYVANIGQNRLFHNNGDGTFTDVTETAAIKEDRWTTSCLFADLNGDSLPDIYDVNFVQGENAFRRICDTKGSCDTVNFESDYDKLFFNLGDGTFQEVTETSGIKVPNGPGLGIVAADFDNRRLLSIYVANDSQPSFFFLNQTKDRSGPPVLVEQGVMRGLAYSGDGRPQGCMGVAIGDYNGDHLLDLFVTNFWHDYNTLRMGRPRLMFEDVTSRAGIYDVSFDLLGFGTQFIDGELDGWPDLILTNGNVDALDTPPRPLRMRPQYLRNQGNGKFGELRGKEIGAFFDREELGRGLARLDWNRDGKEDVIISHLDTPAALVTNETPDTGHYLAVRLIGVHSDRDAIGTKLRLEFGGRVVSGQLTAGDGYHASNQRQLVFGLGEHRQVDLLKVSWMSGQEQSFRDVPADAEILLVEGSNQITVLPQ